MMNGFGGMMFGWIFWIIIIAVIIWAVIQFVNKSASQSKQEHTNESPLEILKRRYAKGEITKDEFERMKKDLIS